MKKEINCDKFDEKKMYYLAYYDDSTGLKNEKYFCEKLKERIKKINTDKKLVVLYLKLNNFEDLSNIIGYENSNNFIKEVGEVILDFSLEIDILSVFRGNHFLILFTISEVDFHEKLKNQIKLFLLKMKKYINEINFEYLLKINIGISFFPDHAENPENLISKAHHAMYLVDKSADDYKIYDQKMFIDKLDFESLQRDLKRAINEQELFIEFQPKVDTYTEKIVSFEALSRWRHYIRGIISPDKFISIAEKTGLIKKIGIWVLDQCFRQLKEWEELGFENIKISVNMSEIELNDPNIIRTIKRISKKYSISNNRIEFEITERAFKEVSKDIMNDLKHMGFLISLDDFGTGYSSLSYFGKSPFDYLKLDKTFIDNIGEEKNKILVESVINLAHKFEVEVIAEGVETKDQLEILKEMCCDYIQGYYFYKPMTANQVKNLLESM